MISRKTYSNGIVQMTTGITRGILFFIVLAAASVSATAFAELETTDPAKVEPLSRMKEVTGVVTGRTRYNLSVEYEVTESSSREMVLPVDDKTQLSGFKSLSEIKTGDTIKAVYKQLYEKKDDSSEMVVGTAATKVALVKSGTNASMISKEN